MHIHDPSSSTAFGKLDRIRAKFDDAIPIFHPLLDEADTELAARAQAIVDERAERDRQAALHRQELALRDQQLVGAGSKLDHLTWERDQARISIEEYKNSRSWRITKPLRELRKLQMEIGKFVH